MTSARCSSGLAWATWSRDAAVPSDLAADSAESTLDVATVGIRQAVPYALYYGGAAVLLMFPTLIVALLNTFGGTGGALRPSYGVRSECGRRPQCSGPSSVVCQCRRADEVCDPKSVVVGGGKRWAPASVHGPVAVRIGVDDAHQDCAHDASADLPQPIAVLLDVGLAQHVVPKWSLGIPAVLGQPHLFGAQRLQPERLSDGLSRGESRRLAALEVAPGKRVIGLLLDAASDRRRQPDQRLGQPSVDLLGPLRRRFPGYVEQHRPADDARRRHRFEPDQVRKERQRLGRLADDVPLPDLGVAVPVGGIGELQWNLRRGGWLINRRTLVQQSHALLFAHEHREKIVEQPPVVVPRKRASGLVEHVRFRAPRPLEAALRVGCGRESARREAGSR